MRLTPKDISGSPSLPCPLPWNQRVLSSSRKTSTSSKLMTHKPHLQCSTAFLVQSSRMLASLQRPGMVRIFTVTAHSIAGNDFHITYCCCDENQHGDKQVYFIWQLLETTSNLSFHTKVKISTNKAELAQKGSYFWGLGKVWQNPKWVNKWTWSWQCLSFVFCVGSIYISFFL